jgi:hypothetical protein
MQSSNHDFFCVGVMFSGEYDVCGVTLSVYAHRTSLKNMHGHFGNRTYDLWSTSSMICQLSPAVDPWAIIGGGGVLHTHTPYGPANTTLSLGGDANFETVDSQSYH